MTKLTDLVGVPPTKIQLYFYQFVRTQTGSGDMWLLSHQPKYCWIFISLLGRKPVQVICGCCPTNQNTAGFLSVCEEKKRFS